MPQRVTTRSHLSRRVLVCAAHGVPLLAAEQKLLAPGASRRFWLYCRRCPRAVRIVASIVNEGARLPMGRKGR